MVITAMPWLFMIQLVVFSHELVFLFTTTEIFIVLLDFTYFSFGIIGLDAFSLECKDNSSIFYFNARSLNHAHYIPFDIVYPWLLNAFIFRIFLSLLTFSLLPHLTSPCSSKYIFIDLLCAF